MTTNAPIVEYEYNQDNDQYDELSTYDYIRYMHANLYKKEVPENFQGKKWKGQPLINNEFHEKTVHGFFADNSITGNPTRFVHISRNKNKLLNIMGYHYNDSHVYGDDLVSDLIDECIKKNSNYKNNINDYLGAGLKHRDYEAARKYFGYLEKYSPSAHNFSMPITNTYRMFKKGARYTIDKFRGYHSNRKGSNRKGETKKYKRKNTLKNRLKYRHF